MEPRAASDESHSPAAAEERDGFKFRSGSLALDLAATLAARLTPAPRELLAAPRDLGRWLVAAGLEAGRPKVSGRDLIEARELREALYRLASSCAKGEAYDARSRALVNRWAMEPQPAPQLGARGLSWHGRGAHASLAAVARDGVELLGGPLAARLRKCAREGCSILFVDRSRTGRRRWCSMSACGNKAKVDAFRKRRSDA
jgi:predicted RNA-binding Zn ribbon-like protein